MFPNARISCVDWFANAEAEAAFDQNTAPFADRLEKLPGTSVDVLLKLTAHGRRFDLMYIDGDHQFDAVMMDTILSWPLLRVGGFLIWDDYLWSHPDVPNLTPKAAIDAWLATRKPSTRYVFAGAQVCVQKTASDPILRDMSGKLIAPPAERP